MTNEELAYCAGILDGEGTITIKALESHHYATKYTVPHYHVLYVYITNSHIETLEWIKTYWGGSIHPLPRLKKNHKQIYQWIATSVKASTFLKDVAPFIRIKRPQLNLARDLRALGKLDGTVEEKQKLYQKRVKIVEQIRQANKRGV